MFWTVRGANAILALCRCRLSRRFEDYWADRAARSSTVLSRTRTGETVRKLLHQLQ
jgi:hypothetical protein